MAVKSFRNTIVRLLFENRKIRNRSGKIYRHKTFFRSSTIRQIENEYFA